MQFPLFKTNIDFTDKAVHTLSELLQDPAWHPVVGLDCGGKHGSVYVNVIVKNSAGPIAGVMKIKLFSHSEDEGEYIETTQTITGDGSHPINLIELGFRFLDVEIELSQGSADIIYSVSTARG